MKVKDLEFIIGYSQKCKCIIRYNDPDKDDREIWGPFGSIYNWISKFYIVRISTNHFERDTYLYLSLKEE